MDVKGAVDLAVMYIKQLLPEETLRDLRLEEVERTDDDQYWLVTLGFSTPTTASSLVQSLGGSTFERQYKLLKVNAQTAEVTSMKIRKIG